jgi:hypothetical protein
VAQRVRITLAPGQQIVIDPNAATLRVRGGLRVQVERRS